MTTTDILRRIVAEWDAGTETDRILTPDLIHEARVLVAWSAPGRTHFEGDACPGGHIIDPAFGAAFDEVHRR